MRKKITAVLTALVMLTGCSANASVSSENASSSSGFSSESASSSSDFSSEVSAEGPSYGETQSVTQENDNVNNLDSDEMKVHFIDVGQGDSIFIELPNTKTMLIDAAENEYADRITNYIIPADTIRLIMLSPLIRTAIISAVWLTLSVRLMSKTLY